MNADVEQCPKCTGEATLLGMLGDVLHLRCRACGWTWPSGTTSSRGRRVRFTATKTPDALESDIDQLVLLRATNLVRTHLAGHSTKRALAALVRAVLRRDEAAEAGP